MKMFKPLAIVALIAILSFPSLSHTPTAKRIVPVATAPTATECSTTNSPVQFHKTTGTFYCCEDTDTDGEWEECSPAGGATSEAGLESDLTDVSDVYTDNDGSLAPTTEAGLESILSDVSDVYTDNDTVPDDDDVVTDYILDGSDRMILQRSGQVLSPGVDHTAVIWGDSLASETPFGNCTANGTAQQLQNLLGADPDYTATTGANLIQDGLTYWSCVSPSTWDDPNDDLVLTTTQSGFGADTWKARCIYDDNNTGIDISANPTDRYILSFTVEATNLSADGAIPTIAEGPDCLPDSASSTTDVIYVMAEANGCSDDIAMGFWADNGGSSMPGIRIGFSPALGAKYYMVVDPTDWNYGGDDHSGASGFGDGTCKVRLWFQGFSRNSATAKTYTIGNLDFRRAAYSTRVIRQGMGSQTLAGVKNYVWPFVKARHYTSKTRPVDLAIIQTGLNDYNGQGALQVGGSAGTPTSTDESTYWADLNSLKADLDSDGVEVLKVATFSGRQQEDLGWWGGTTGSETYIAWNIFKTTERDFLIQNDWNFIDPDRWYETQVEDTVLSYPIAGGDLPGAGACIEVPMGSVPTQRPWTLKETKLVSSVATSGDDASNKWCVQFWNKSITTAISSEQCSDASAIVAYERYHIPKTGSSLTDGQVLTFKACRTGTPTDMSSAFWTAYLSVRSGEYGDDSYYTIDGTHLSLGGYRLFAESLYQAITGKSNLGHR